MPVEILSSVAPAVRDIWKYLQGCCPDFFLFCSRISPVIHLGIPSGIFPELLPEISPGIRILAEAARFPINGRFVPPQRFIQ